MLVNSISSTRLLRIALVMPSRVCWPTQAVVSTVTATDLLAQHKRFLERAGATVKDGVEIEVTPLASYAGEGLESVKGKTFSKSGVADSVEELDALV